MNVFSRISHSWPRRRRSLAAACLVLAAPPVLATPVAELRSALPQLLHFYAAHSAFDLPVLTTDELDELADGVAVVKVSGQAASDSDDEVIGMGVYGLQIVEAPRLLLWLTLMGGNDERDYRLTPAMLSRGPSGAYVRYQHVDLPWPVRDRHWVIRCEKNLQLADASGGEIWEHHWTLEHDGMTQVNAGLADNRYPQLAALELDEAIYLPSNRGAWALVELAPNRTLVMAYVDAALGGSFPSSIVRRFTRRKLKAGLASLQELSAKVHLNYSEERLIHDGHGAPIAREDALRSALRWRDALQIATRQ